MAPNDATIKVAEGHHLRGHLGNLTMEQEQALVAFKEELANNNLYTPATSSDADDVDTAASHDDATLLRFLRARSFDIAGAHRQFSDAEKWRQKYGVDELYTSARPEDMKDAQRFYPRWTGRRDKLGIPVFVYRLASLDSTVQRDLDAIPADDRYKRIIALYEYMCRFIFPLCSHLPHSTTPTPISSTLTIIDLESVAFGSMWRLRSHLQEASKLSTANYPETLHTIVIVNSPSFFPTIWNWIKGWFDEGTRQKIHVLGKDPGSTLQSLVDPEHIPVAYGGLLEWKFEDDPQLDDCAKKLVGEQIPPGPIIFTGGTVVKLQGS